MGGVDDEAAKARVFEIVGAAHGGMKYTRSFAAAGLPRFEPRDRQRLKLGVWQIVVLAPHEWLAPDESGAVGG